jgi:hypothetical protein
LLHLPVDDRQLVRSIGSFLKKLKDFGKQAAAKA